ncbi:MAG: hypothetical protein ACF8XB_07275 [Planctomycetota bacterium JB042]
MRIARNVFFALVAVVLIAASGLVLLARHGAPPLPAVEDVDENAWGIGYRALRGGDDRTALAFLRRVPKDHPEYARAMRYCAWNLLARNLGRPKDAVAYVEESLRHDPFDANVWEDLVRVYVGAAFPFVDV